MLLMQPLHLFFFLTFSQNNQLYLTLEALRGGGQIDDVIAKNHAICVLTAKSQFFARNLLNTYNFTMDLTYFVDFNR